MYNTIHLNRCPVCHAENISSIFKAKDYTVSQDEFSILHCQNCSLRFTQNIPDLHSISSFYQSEDYISHSDTNKGFINRIYQLVKKRTLSGKRNLIIRSTGLHKGNHLDVGCGTGAFANKMLKAEWTVTGLEPDSGARAVAEKMYGLKILNADELFNLPANSFDAITLWHVLEHVHDMHGYVKQLKNLLKENGKLFIAVPNYTSYDAQVYKQYWAAYDVPRHLYHFSPASMKNLIEQHELKIISYKPMWFDSVYVSLLSSKYKNVKTNFIRAMWTGLVSNLRALFDIKKCSSVIYIISK
jgi:2-polyprenyl-3-methyl-5-hydroxy-6-metoxy-1,4-benzoquinol methylase